MGTFDEMSESALRAALDWAYDRALSPGVPGVESVAELAEAYRGKAHSMRACADSLIRWQAGKTAAAGFVTALGGFATLPLTLTVDVAATYFIQLRMVATIATLGGLDPADPDIRAACYRCLGPDAGGPEEAVSASVLTRIAGKRWLARAGKLRVRRLGKLVPVLGGAVNGTLNGVLTWKIGQRALERFMPVEL